MSSRGWIPKPTAHERANVSRFEEPRDVPMNDAMFSQSPTAPIALAPEKSTVASDRSKLSQWSEKAPLLAIAPSGICQVTVQNCVEPGFEAASSTLITFMLTTFG